MTPTYYHIMSDGQDLYDMFMQMFPEQSVRDHLKMTTIEYVYRAGEKHDVPKDKRKAVGVLKRMAELFPAKGDEPESVECLPEKLVRLWCEANGYGLVPPNKAPSTPAAPGTPIRESFLDEAAFAPAEDHTLEEMTEEAKAIVREHVMQPSTGSAAPVRDYAPPSRDASVLQAAISFWEDAHQRSIMTDAKALEGIRHTLSASMWAPHIHYWSHAKKLHEELPALFPLVPKMEW